MALIYRVEDKDGKGPYVNRHEGVGMEMQDKMRHPTPTKDAKLCDTWSSFSFMLMQKYYFGFASMEQLKFWIYRKDWRENLDAAGFSISVYESITVIAGDTQAIFIRGDLKPIQKISFLEI